MLKWYDAEKSFGRICLLAVSLPFPPLFFWESEPLASKCRFFGEKRGLLARALENVEILNFHLTKITRGLIFGIPSYAFHLFLIFINATTGVSSKRR